MTNNEHTPFKFTSGPYDIRSMRNGYRLCAPAPNGILVATATRLIQNEQSIANARLFAAAPQLAQFVYELTKLDSDPTIWLDRDIVREASELVTLVTEGDT